MPSYVHGPQPSYGLLLFGDQDPICSLLPNLHQLSRHVVRSVEVESTEEAQHHPHKFSACCVYQFRHDRLMNIIHEVRLDTDLRSSGATRIHSSHRIHHPAPDQWILSPIVDVSHARVLPRRSLQMLVKSTAHRPKDRWACNASPLTKIGFTCDSKNSFQI